MAKTATSTLQPATTSRPQRLRWHPARLLYIFVVTLLVGILYSEAQALLADPSSALDPSQLQHTFFWHLALTYPAYFAAVSLLAVGAAILGWRVERRYAAAQDEQRHQETAATAQVVAEQVVQRAQAGGQIGNKTAPHDLPPRAPGFVGRQGDLAQIEAALRQGQAVAVVGMGGLGKSSLAAEAVYALAAEPEVFPGGITWVRCDERTELEGLIWIEDQLLAAWSASLPSEATARAKTPEEGLELRERALRKRLGALDAAAQPSTKLVLLDNVEPGLSLGRLLDTLAPLGIVSLVTTRVEPTSQHIRLLNLEVLDVDVGVRLFAERYADRGGKWDAARDTPVTRTIVGALGGLPLAIELAAARAARTRLPLALLADELRAPDALARLNDPRDPSSGVRYSLRKTLLALSPSQRARFAALGLPEGADSPLPVIECMFVGVPAARDGVAPAQDDLEALVAYSLMSLSPAEEAQTSRVRLHPLVRELAREEWAQQPQTTQRAAVAALLAGVQTWVTEHAQAFDLLARDEDLIAGIFRTAAEQRIDLQMVVTSIETFEDYLFWRNMQLREELFKLLLVIERAMGDRRGELRALRSLMSTATFLGKSDEDQQYTEEALGVARTLGDPEELASSLGAAAGWAHDHGRVEEARKWYEEASPLARSLEPGPGRSRLFNNLGNAASAVGNYREAATFYERAVASARALGDMTDEAVAQVGLVGSLKMLGDYATARRILEESFAKVRATGSAIGIATGMDLFGEFALHMQDIGEATRCFAEALRLFESIEDAQMIAHERGNLAVVEAEGARQRGDDTQARQHYEEALAIFQPLGIPYNHIARDYEDFVRERLATLGEQ